MVTETLTALVQKYCETEVHSVTEVKGGYRNKIYQATTNKGNIILKKHRSARETDDFINEVAAYKMLGKCGCRIPALLFADNAERVLGIQQLKGKTLEERQSSDYYLETVRLLVDTYQKTGHLKDDGTLSFRRLPKEIFEGMKLLKSSGEFNPSPSFGNYAKRCYELLAKTSPQLIIGSFIPANVIRLNQDYHIDLELVSYGRPSDDLAYFSLFSGVNMFDVLAASGMNLNISEDLFLASMMHLGTLASGVYFADAQEELAEEQRKMIEQRITNFSSILFKLQRPEFEELAEVLERKKW